MKVKVLKINRKFFIKSMERTIRDRPCFNKSVNSKYLYKENLKILYKFYQLNFRN